MKLYAVSIVEGLGSCLRVRKNYFLAVWGVTGSPNTIKNCSEWGRHGPPRAHTRRAQSYGLYGPFGSLAGPISAYFGSILGLFCRVPGSGTPEIPQWGIGLAPELGILRLVPQLPFCHQWGPRQRSGPIWTGNLHSFSVGILWKGSRERLKPPRYAKKGYWN